MPPISQLPDLHLWLLALATAFSLVCLLSVLRMKRVGTMARRQMGRTAGSNGAEGVSIIVTCQEQQSELARLLPLLLSQQYDGEYEVIVVDKLGDRDTLEWLEAMEGRFPHLHHTFCPPTARDISIQRLALSLGVKASDYEWLVFLPADAQLPGDGWLTQLMSACDGEADAVFGVAHYADGGGWFGQKVRFRHLWQQLAWLPIAHRHSPLAPSPLLLCYRRSHFLAHQGFASSGLLAVGAEELLVNHNIGSSRCRVCLLPGAAVELPLPSSYIWHRELLYAAETRRHLRRAFWPRLTNAARMMLFPLYTLYIIVASLTMVSLELPCGFPFGSGWTACWLWLLWLTVCLVQWFMLKGSSVALGQRRPPLALPLLLLWLPHNELCTWLRWFTTKKDIFRKKFV